MSKAGHRRSPSPVAASPGVDVNSYTELVEAIADLTYVFHDRYLVYRGQIADHRTRGGLNSILRPTLFRLSGPRNRLDQLKELENLERMLRDMLPDYVDRIGTILKYREAIWALVQHYGLMPTPLLDVTRSVHVAATFATENPESGGDRFVYVLATAYPNDQISVSTRFSTMLITLQPFLPAEARRHLFQEALLLGRWPMNLRTDSRMHDFSNLLLGKYRIPEEGLGAFWDAPHSAISMEALVPNEDPMLRAMLAILNEFN